MVAFLRKKNYVCFMVRNVQDLKEKERREAGMKRDRREKDKC